MIEVRKGNGDEIVLICNLCELMHRESPVYRTLNFDWLRMRDLLLRAWAEDSFLLSVAISEGQIIGLFVGFISKTFFGHDTISEDVLVYVLPEHRRTSAAIQLVKSYEQWAKSNGVKKIRAGTTAGINTEKVVAFYERLGYSGIGKVLEKNCY